MKNIILGIIGVGIVVFLVMNSKNAPTEVVDENLSQENFTQNTNNQELVAKLSANTWIWDRTVMNDDTIIIPAKTDAFSVTFTSDGNLSGTTDCNGFFGNYTTGENNGITFGPLASTLMFCEGSQEAVFTKNISDSNSVFFTEEGNLVLLLPYDSGSVIFRK